MNIKKLYENNKGFTTQEIIISIIIIIIFVSIITSGFYNYYMTIQSKNRRAIATNIIIDVIENIEIMNYEDITIDKVNDLIKSLEEDGTIKKPYKVSFILQNYNELEGNEDKKDLLKILKVTVQYTANEKEEKYEITRLIKK